MKESIPDKTILTVGKCTMSAQIVPVNLIMDQIDFKDPHFRMERFRLIEIDGYYIISVEQYHHNDKLDFIDLCFLTSDEAWNYLEMYGIEKKDYINEEEETVPNSEYE